MSEIITVGLDLAKNILQVHGADGTVILTASYTTRWDTIELAGKVCGPPQIIEDYPDAIASRINARSMSLAIIAKCWNRQSFAGTGTAWRRVASNSISSIRSVPSHIGFRRLALE